MRIRCSSSPLCRWCCSWRRTGRFFYPRCVSDNCRPRWHRRTGRDKTSHWAEVKNFGRGLAWNRDRIFLRCTSCVFLHPADECLLGNHDVAANAQCREIRFMHQLVPTGRRDAQHLRHCLCVTDIQPTLYIATENRVSIYTNYQCVRQHKTCDEYTALCVELETKKAVCWSMEPSSAYTETDIPHF